MDERGYNLRLQAQEKLLVPLNTKGEIRVVVGYANRYWLAMSNLGFQAVFRLFARERRFQVERAYFPEHDPNYFRTFESARPLNDCEILALSVSFETDYPNVVAMLEAAGLDLDSSLEVRPRQSDGGSIRPLLIGGGAALTLNAEPLANLFDAIVIGEGEEIVQEITDAYLAWRERDESFESLLRKLAQIEGVYVPSLYHFQYGEGATVVGYTSDPEAPRQVSRRYVKNISDFPTHTIIQTPETEFRSMFMTETGRGCEVGCKFCVAGYMYRPIRKRTKESIDTALQVGLEKSESIGFVGAAVSSHPHIAQLARSVAEQGKRAALSSIMSQRVTPELAESLSESEYKTVALAPEAGSERLRFRVGKRVLDEQIVDAVRTLAKNGIRHFKLYFMVGLPSETDSDVEAIPELVARAQEAALAAAREQNDFRVAPTLFLSVNGFIPKAWTPFQRHCFLSLRTLKSKLKIVQRGIARIPNVEMKFESPRESYFQTLMSRGDRRVGDVLIWLHRNRRDWRWLVQHGEDVIVEGVPSAEEYVARIIPEHEMLPWEVVDMHIKRSLLEREYARTFSDDVSPAIARARAEYNDVLRAREASREQQNTESVISAGGM